VNDGMVVSRDVAKSVAASNGSGEAALRKPPDLRPRPLSNTSREVEKPMHGTDS